MEIVLANSLFPGSLSVEDRTRHWVFISHFYTLSSEGFECNLVSKAEVEKLIASVLTLSNKDKKEVSEEVEKKMKMSASFEDTTKAQDCFRKLDMLKDRRIFNLLGKLLNEQKTEDAQTIRGQGT